MICVNATTSVSTAPVTRRKVDELRPHPRQAAVFTDLPDAEIGRLAEDIRINGLQHPVEVLPDGTVVCGHQRLRAARLLGWDEIAVRVREDLAAQGEAAVEERLIGDNLNRRQLDPLGQARCYRRLKELAEQLPEDRRGSHPRCDDDVRDLLARRFNMSGRNLDRYERILDAPREVQDAFSGGKLTLKEAGAVAGLGEEARAEVAAALRAGEDPTAAVGRHLRKASGRHRHAANACAAFVRVLKKGVEDLEGRLDAVGKLSAEDVAALRQGKAAIERLLKGAGEQDSEPAACGEEPADTVSGGEE